MGGETLSVQCENEACFGSSNDGSPVALPVTLGGMEKECCVSFSRCLCYFCGWVLSNMEEVLGKGYRFKEVKLMEQINVMTRL